MNNAKPYRYWIDTRAVDAGIKFAVTTIRGCTVKKKHEGLERQKRVLLGTVRYDPADHILAGYRESYKALNITGALPSPEILHQLFQRSERLPQISTAVDAYNCISLLTNLVISAHDYDKLLGDVRLVIVDKDEMFYPLGREKEIVPTGEWAVRDDQHLLCRLNCKQSALSSVSDKTTNILLYIQGNVNTDDDYIRDGMSRTTDLITQFCGGLVQPLS